VPKIFLGIFFIPNKYCGRGTYSMGTMFYGHHFMMPCFDIIYYFAVYGTMFYGHQFYVARYFGHEFMWHHILRA